MYIYTYIYVHIYIYYIYNIYIKNLRYVCGCCEHQKTTYFFHTDIFRYCIPLSVYVCVYVCVCVCVCVCMCVIEWVGGFVCVKDTCWKFSIYHKFTIAELLKLTKAITWRHKNIVLKLEKIKFTNTLKNSVQFVAEINSTMGTKQ